MSKHIWLYWQQICTLSRST